jgi:serralysin
VFNGLGKATGKLKEKAFWLGTKAHDSSDRIIYDKPKGALYHDPDGTGKAPKVKFATINKVTLTHDDFWIM